MGDKRLPAGGKVAVRSTGEGGDSPPRAGQEFADGAVRLAGHMGLSFGWTPDIFWAATPAEIAVLVQAAAGEAPDALGARDLATLMEAFPDG